MRLSEGTSEGAGKVHMDTIVMTKYQMFFSLICVRMNLGILAFPFFSSFSFLR